MDERFDTALDLSLDSLETAFSDSTRKLVRQIKTEWQMLVKFKCDVSAKESELVTAKEKLAHLNEIKIQNEKYHDLTMRKVENLKLSNIQLKSKLSNLKNEEERVAKNCSEMEEYMHKKIVIYQGKWHERYELHYSKNPKVQEKERNMKIVEELKKKLCALNDEYQKYEKELFQAKCERNRRNTDGGKFFPFKNFIVNVAKIYLDIKNTYEQCEVISNEITPIDNRIKQLKAKHQTVIKSKTSLNSENTQNLELNSTDEKNIPKQNLLKCINYQPNIDKRDISLQRVESFQNDSLSSDNVLNQVNFLTNENTKSNNLCIKENIDNKNEVPPRTTKVRKWLERLKIVSKFTITSENNEKDIKSSFLPLEINKGNEVLYSNKLKTSDNERKDTEILINDKDSNTGISSNQKVTQTTKNVDINTSRKCVTQTISNNTSKYFQKRDSIISKENWDALSNEDIKKSESFDQDNMKQQQLENWMDVDEEMPENKNDLQKKAGRFEDTMDVDGEIKNNEGCSINNVHNNLQDKTMKENLNENAFCSVRSNDVKVIAKSLLDDTAANIDSSFSNNDNAKDDQIQFEKMDVDELVAKEQKDSQKCANESNTMNDKTVVAQNKYQETLVHDLNLEQTQTSENSSNKTSAENLQNGADTETVQHANNEKYSNSTSSPACVSKILTPLTGEQTPKTIESIPQTPSQESNTQLQNSTKELSNSNLISFKPEAISPGFVYTSRLMYQAIASTSGTEPSTLKKDLQNNAFEPMAFFSNIPQSNIQPVQSPEEDKIEFLASAYEDYLADSPPIIKGKEKSMFALAEDSPDKDDFLPLFAAGNGDSNKDTQGDGAQFTFNFCSSSKTQSPDEDSGFKFLF